MTLEDREEEEEENSRCVFVILQFHLSLSSWRGSSLESFSCPIGCALSTSSSELCLKAFPGSVGTCGRS